MQIRFLPSRHRTKSKRRVPAEAIVCELLERRRIQRDARLEVWLLDADRRETDRARGYDKTPVTLPVTANIHDLRLIAIRLGEGLYRLTARGSKGRIIARRDFEAARLLPSSGERHGYAARTEVEQLKAALEAAEDAKVRAEQARDAAEAQVVALRAAVADRDTQIEALEEALIIEREHRERARRVFLGVGDEAPAAPSASRRPAGRTAARPERGERDADSLASMLTGIDAYIDALDPLVRQLMRLGQRPDDAGRGGAGSPPAKPHRGSP